MALDHECHDRNVKVSTSRPAASTAISPSERGASRSDSKLEMYLDNEDVAEAVIFAVTQPKKSRVFLIGMRPLVESL
ncbi:MAG: hypothetical protein U0521_13290 [Anaerolineae bacterium]